MSFSNPGEFDLENKVSRKETERVDMECPQACANTRGMRQVTHHTGRGAVVELPYGDGRSTRRRLSSPTIVPLTGCLGIFWPTHTFQTLCRPTWPMGVKISSMSERR
ncbi:MAG: hypothetical protein ACI8VE_002814 [Natrialbaceae archaeon]|jgi:hypothetical protein